MKLVVLTTLALEVLIEVVALPGAFVQMSVAFWL